MPNELKKAGSAVAYVDFEMLESSARMDSARTREKNCETQALSDYLYYVNGYNKDDLDRLANGNNGDRWSIVQGKHHHQHAVTQRTKE